MKPIEVGPGFFVLICRHRPTSSWRSTKRENFRKKHVCSAFLLFSYSLGYDVYDPRFPSNISLYVHFWGFLFFLALSQSHGFFSCPFSLSSFFYRPFIPFPIRGSVSLVATAGLVWLRETTPCSFRRGYVCNGGEDGYVAGPFLIEVQGRPSCH